jgi:glucose/mannose-6-phosphate isomerase
MAIGYSVVGQLVLCAKAGIINFTKEDLDKIIEVMKVVSSKTNANVPTLENEAKKIAVAMKNKVTFFVSSEHLVGPMHVVNNQANENAKHFTADYTIPELNHHLLEGMGHPTPEYAKLFGFFANSSLYSEKIAKRFAITEEVCKKQNIEVYEFKAKALTKIAQAFELIQLGAYMDFYLSMLYEINPAPIPWVDFFKERLGQPLGK